MSRRTLSISTPEVAFGTVTSIATTAPVTGGTITATGTIAVSDFVASGASHARGTVPDPGASSGTTKFLREDASWQVPTAGANTALSNLASTAVNVPILLPDGAVGAPSIGFTSQSDHGFFYVSGSEFDVAVHGAGALVGFHAVGVLQKVGSYYNRGNGDYKMGASDDANMSRIGAADIAFGNGTAGDKTAALEFGTVKTYDGLATAGMGMSPIVANVRAVAQVAAITTTNLIASVPANAMYDANFTVNCTTTSAAATVNITVSWTDTGSQAQSSTLGSAVACTALGASSMGNLHYGFAAKAGTAITYATAIVNTPTYDIRGVLKQLTIN